MSGEVGVCGMGILEGDLGRERGCLEREGCEECVMVISWTGDC